MGMLVLCAGVVRSLRALNRLKRVYCTETRPYNQGSRLTAYEMVAEGIPATLITDSMAALTMREMDITGAFLSTASHPGGVIRTFNLEMCCFLLQPWL